MDLRISSQPRPNACLYVIRPLSSRAPILTQGCNPQCATSLASTFDPDMIYQAGVYLGQEAKVKSSTVLLAPTCNIQRTPLGGRSFESFSEDPFLSGKCAALAGIHPTSE